VIDITEHALRGLPLAQKLNVLAEALRAVGDCAWPSADGIEVIPLGGGKLYLTVDAAITRVGALRKQRAALYDTPAPQGGTLLTYDARGQRCVPVADPVDSFAFTPGPRTTFRRVGGAD
jgi:hypothetical protein